MDNNYYLKRKLKGLTYYKKLINDFNSCLKKYNEQKMSPKHLEDFMLISYKMMNFTVLWFNLVNPLTPYSTNKAKVPDFFTSLENAIRILDVENCSVVDEISAMEQLSRASYRLLRIF